MNSKIYRCGHCGCPTDKDGHNLVDENFKRVVNLIENYSTSNSHTELVHGDCCVYMDNQDNLVQITRDMAIDAGDMSLEGQWIKW